MYLIFRLRTCGIWAVLCLAVRLGFGIQAQGQAATEVSKDAASAGHGRILLVLPFDNRTGQPSLEWIREAAPELLSSRFTSAGFAPMSREDRLYAFDHLGLPGGFQPSRASALKLAQMLDADSIVVGSYLIDGTNIVADAQVVDVPHLHMSQQVTARGDMHDMIAVFDSLAWRLTRLMDPGFPVAEETFVAAGKGLRLDAFEQYIRGIAEQDHNERLLHLKKAVAISPDYGSAWMGLGREDYGAQQYEDAASAFAKVSHDDPDVLEAGFYRGLSLLFSGSYQQAQSAFLDVAKVLPLAEVLNNEGVAAARQAHDASAFFIAAETTDPNSADYHFNLALSLKKRGATTQALSELAQCLKLRPNDSEAQELLKEWKTPAAVVNASTASEGNDKSDPLERIARAFDAAAFKQAAQMMDQMQAARMAALSPRDRALRLAGQAKDYLDRGLLLEAERLYQSAVATDSAVAEAHSGLAEVRERTGDTARARKEAQAALELKPSAEAYLVLARLDLAVSHLDQAGKEAGQALQLDPSNKAAQDVNRLIALRSGKSQ